MPVSSASCFCVRCRARRRSASWRASEREVESERLQLSDGLWTLGLGLCFEFSDELVERRHTPSMGYIAYPGVGKPAASRSELRRGQSQPYPSGSDN